MNEVWLTIKSWLQRLVLAAVFLYAMLFVYNNSGDTVKFWFWFHREHSTTVFFLTAGAFVSGIVFTILVHTAFKTIRQIRELNSRSRTEKLERDINEMKTKAAMLQTKENVAGASGRSESVADGEIKQ